MRKLDVDHQAFLSQRFLAWLGAQPEAASLRGILLGHGGLEIVAPPNNWEGDMKILLEQGEIMNLPRVCLSMEDNGCHQNAAKLFQQTNKSSFGVGTGWALTDDLWRQHSWCVGDGKLIETTVEAEAYYGVVLYEHDAVTFCQSVL